MHTETCHGGDGRSAGETGSDLTPLERVFHRLEQLAEESSDTADR